MTTNQPTPPLSAENPALYEELQVMGKCIAMGKHDEYGSFKGYCRQSIHKAFEMGQAYAAQQCAEKDKRIAELELLSRSAVDTVNMIDEERETFEDHNAMLREALELLKDSPHPDDPGIGHYLLVEVPDHIERTLQATEAGVKAWEAAKLEPLQVENEALKKQITHLNGTIDRQQWLIHGR